MKPDTRAGEAFQTATRLSRRPGSRVESGPLPAMPPRKIYPDAPSIPLPAPEFRGLGVEETIRRRRSRRTFAKTPMTLDQLSQLLWAAQGETGQQFESPVRAAPSAGALYPIELYVFAHRVRGLERGLYHYPAPDHRLERLIVGDFRQSLVNSGLQQPVLGDSGAVFLMTGIFDRVRHRYGERGVRYAYIEAGHISENIFLQAVSLGLDSLVVGAFYDDEVENLADLDGKDETALYLHAVGMP